MGWNFFPTALILFSLQAVLHHPNMHITAITVGGQKPTLDNSIDEDRIAWNMSLKHVPLAFMLPYSICLNYRFPNELFQLMVCSYHHFYTQIWRQINQSKITDQFVYFAQSIKNYRPICLVCTVSKVLEWIVCDKIIDF